MASIEHSRSITPLSMKKNRRSGGARKTGLAPSTVENLTFLGSSRGMQRWIMRRFNSELMAIRRSSGMVGPLGSATRRCSGLDHKMCLVWQWVETNLATQSGNMTLVADDSPEIHESNTHFSNLETHAETAPSDVISHIVEKNLAAESAKATSDATPPWGNKGASERKMGSECLMWSAWHPGGD